MKKERIFPTSLKWPRWKYPFKWFSIILYIPGLVVFFIPDLEKKYRFILGIFLLMLPILIQTFLWITKIIVIILKRTNYYQNIFSEREELKELLFHVLRDYIKNKIIEIIGAKYQTDKLYIVLKNNLKLNLKEGNKIVVIDRRDSVYLGQFEITEVRNSECIAVGIDVNPVWHGYIRQKGETTMMPNMAAFNLPSGE